jgi:hypothetical protein
MIYGFQDKQTGTSWQNSAHDSPVTRETYDHILAIKLCEVKKSKFRLLD